MRREYDFDYSKAERGRYSKRLLKEGSKLGELERALALGLVGAVKGGPRDVAERHSEYLKSKLRGRK